MNRDTSAAPGTDLNALQDHAEAMERKAAALLPYSASLHDQFMMAALTGLLASDAAFRGKALASLTKDCRALADAFMAERGKK